MNIFQVFGERIRSAIASLPLDVPADALSRVAVEPPRDASHGDMATNAAMVLAKPAGKKPREIAAALGLDKKQVDNRLYQTKRRLRASVTGAEGE